MTGQVRRWLSAVTMVAAVLAVGVEQGRSQVSDEAPGEDGTVPGKELEVFLLVIGPSKDPVSRFGHSALWIKDNKNGTDIAYNYGLSLTTPGGAAGRFRRLARAEVMVKAATRDPGEMIESYASKDRTVEILRLNLSPAQAAALRDSLVSDARPDRPPYRQDFYLTNCTTGIRDAIDLAIGGQLRDATAGTASPHTYRSHSLRYVSDHALLYLLLLTGMGGTVDQPLTAWEAMFMPETLADGVRQMTITDELGRRVPLVASEEVRYASTRPPIPVQAPAYWPLFLLFGMVCGGVMMLLGTHASASWMARVGFSALSGAWLVLMGVLGTGFAGLWALTDQYLTYGNENLLQASPLALVAGWLVLTGSLRTEKEARLVRWLAVVMASFAVMGLLLKPIPGFSQANASLVLFSLPAHLGFAWALLNWSAEPGEAAVDGTPNLAGLEDGVITA